MPISIVYNDDDENVIYINSFDEINHYHYDTVVYLCCNNSQLTSLPELLPNSLQSFFCEYNQLSKLPELPYLLKNFKCQFNQLKSLPELPDSLEYLWCNNNQLKSLPELPNSLEYLICSDNKLTVLPERPKSLQYLSCYNNKFIKKRKYKYLMKIIYV